MPTPFEQAKELHGIAITLCQLRAKAMNLAVDAKKKVEGEDSRDARKYRVVSELLQQLEDAVEEFNSHPFSNDTIQQKEQLEMLGKKLLSCVETTLATHYAILSAPRNSKRKYANNAVEWGLVGGSAVAACFYSFPVGIGMIGSGKLLSNKVQEYSGLNLRETATIQLLKQMQTLLTDLLQDLSFLHRHSHSI